MTNFHEKDDHFGGRGVTRSQKATIKAFDKFYSMFPSFLDVFPDEDAFLTFAFWSLSMKFISLVKLDIGLSFKLRALKLNLLKSQIPGQSPKPIGYQTRQAKFGVIIFLQFAL